MFLVKCQRFLYFLNKVSFGKKVRPASFFIDERGITTIAVDETDNPITYTEFPAKKEWRIIVSYLCDNGYLTNDARDRYTLTWKGLRPFQVSSAQLFKELVRSVFFPMLVAILTAIITVRCGWSQAPSEPPQLQESQTSEEAVQASPSDSNR